VAPDLDAAAADVAEAERLLRIKEAAEAKGDAPAEGLVEEDDFEFVVFDTHGDRSIAVVKLKKEATWADMKAALLGKMGDGARVYGVRYVDPSQGGKTCLARNEEEWQACWAVASAEKDRELEVDVVKSPPVKPYKLALKANAAKGEKKKIYYPNVYDEPVTFKVAVDGDTMSIKEKEITVDRNDKGAIVLRFVPTEAPKEEVIMVKLEEEGSGIQHTVKVNASWA